MKAMLILLLSVFLLGNTQCSSVPPGAPTPRWTPEIWAASSKMQGIIRNNQLISASNPRFNDFVAVHKTEPRKAQAEMYRILNLCERWKKGADASFVEDAYQFDLLLIENDIYWEQ